MGGGEVHGPSVGDVPQPLLTEVKGPAHAAAGPESDKLFLSGILESAMDAIITIDEAQRIVLFNKAAEDVFRCSREQAIGASLDGFIPERFRGGHGHLVQGFGRT